MERPNFNVYNQKTHEEYFWLDSHPYCKECFNKCKQSHLALEVMCPGKNKIGWGK